MQKKSYANFTDITLESLNMFTMSNEKILKRYKVINPEFLDKYYKNNESIIGVAGHISNWEWAVSIAKHLKHRSVTIYKSLSNKRLGKCFNNNRTRFANMVALERTGRAFKDTSKPSFICNFNGSIIKQNIMDVSY